MAKQATVPGLRGIRWNEAGWFLGAETLCFLCGDRVGSVAVYWAGHAIAFNLTALAPLALDPWSGFGSPVLALHPRCAVRLAHELGEDAEREARRVEGGLRWEEGVA
jgi:hypothetical protein